MAESYLDFPRKFQPLFRPKRYKVAESGRGAAKSWSFARALLLIGKEPGILWPGRTGPIRILCARETQKSIAESVHQLLEDQIKLLNLQDFYNPQKATIIGRNGTQFSFSGIRQLSVADIKSYESVDICWVEEAQVVSKRSWNTLIPTIRKDDSEIWLSYNPELETDETYQRFHVKPPKNAVVIQVSWRDNPWFNDVMRQEMEDLRQRDEAEYQHVWEGTCRQVIEGAIFRNELMAADKQNRITVVPYNPEQPVHTFWDLGFGDNTSIWFAQSIGFEFHLIDFISASGHSLQWYVDQMEAKPYTYGFDYLPHDAKAHELGTGRTIESQLRAMGKKSGRKVKIVPRVSVEDRIQAARAIFGQCWFDADNCADGIQALRHYRYEINEKLQSGGREPLHDWASHPADAFTYFGVAIKEQQVKPKPTEEQRLEALTNPALTPTQRYLTDMKFQQKLRRERRPLTRSGNWRGRLEGM